MIEVMVTSVRTLWQLWSVSLYDVKEAKAIMGILANGASCLFSKLEIIFSGSLW